MDYTMRIYVQNGVSAFPGKKEVVGHHTIKAAAYVYV